MARSNFRLINFINPKFEEGEAEIAEAEIYSFAKNCELTANEFILALEMSADGKLYSEPDTNGNSEKIKFLIAKNIMMIMAFGVIIA